MTRIEYFLGSESEEHSARELVEGAAMPSHETVLGRRSSRHLITARRMTKPPVLVIGAGHSGLVCAALLAEAGLEVTVLEQRRPASSRRRP